MIVKTCTCLAIVKLRAAANYLIGFPSRNKMYNIYMIYIYIYIYIYAYFGTLSLMPLC